MYILVGAAEGGGKLGSLPNEGRNQPTQGNVAGCQGMWDILNDDDDSISKSNRSNN